jgi:hypothetical protein
MKKSFILSAIIAFCLLPIILFSQLEWAPDGAEWYYDFRMYYDRDTIIDGIEAKVLAIDQPTLSYNGDVSEIYYVLGLEEIIVFQEGNKLYYYADSSFHKVYDFGLEIGDTIAIDLSEMFYSYLDIDKESPPIYRIDSIRTFIFNEKEYQGQFYRYLETSIENIDVYLLAFEGWKIEIIGGLESFLPFFSTCFFDGYCIAPLSCYNDLETQIKWVDHGCSDTIRVGVINEFWLENENPTIFPNPILSNQQLIIQFPLQSSLPNGNIHLSLFDIKGRQVLNKRIRIHGNKTVIDNLPTPAGIYFLNLRSPKFSYSKKLLVK